jgi:hypothetical protein
LCTELTALKINVWSQTLMDTGKQPKHQPFAVIPLLRWAFEDSPALRKELACGTRRFPPLFRHRVVKGFLPDVALRGVEYAATRYL